MGEFPSNLPALPQTPNPGEKCEFYENICHPEKGEVGCAVFIALYLQVKYRIGPGKGQFKDLGAYEAAMINFAQTAKVRQCALANLVDQYTANAIIKRREDLGLITNTDF